MGNTRVLEIEEELETIWATSLLCRWENGSTVEAGSSGLALGRTPSAREGAGILSSLGRKQAIGFEGTVTIPNL